MRILPVGLNREMTGDYFAGGNRGAGLLQPLQCKCSPCKFIAGVSISEIVAALGTRRRPAGEKEAEDGTFLSRGVESFGPLDEAGPF